MGALDIHRLHFGFTITFHYLFPQLTMGLALIIVILKILALRSNNEIYHRAARFWAKVFGINFVMGVVTGIPMEFQFGTNWANFSKLTGSVIGQPLMMEGVFSFFLESAFLGIFLFGERRLSKRAHLGAAILIWLGSWLSGFFIVVTDAWMQHPVAYQKLANGIFSLTSFSKLWFNPWAIIQYLHTMCGAVVTASFVMSALGAYYLLENKHIESAKVFLKVGVLTGVIACILQIFPTGDVHGRYMAKYQPATTAAMEGLWNTEKGAPLVLIGQPDAERQRIDNPIMAPKMLSFLIYGTTEATVSGLSHFPKNEWPTNIPLLFYSYRIMAGLGTFFILIMSISVLLLRKGRLFQTRWLLWILMLSFPFPYIANTAGWMTAEIGRQPWLIYGLMRTADGVSPQVSAGNGLFSLLGFMGIYTVLGILFLFLIYQQVQHGPDEISATVPAQ